MIRVAINGLGRIGRASFKVLMNDPEVEVVAVNDLAAPHQLAYLLNFDTVYGKLQKRVTNDHSNLYTVGRAIKVYNIADPSYLPWKDLHIDVVLECTGKFTRREDLQKHLNAGAKHVILSAPSDSEDVLTIVHGVNNNQEANVEMVSCASCTTNCIAPVLEVLERRIGVKKAIMTTVHAYTSNQSVTDGPDNDMRRGRAAAANFIPVATGASHATTKVLPQLRNKFEGVAIQGPVAVGSLADITVVVSRNTSVEEINRIFSEEAGSERYVNILGVNVEPIVSSDIMLDPRASVVDLTMTQVVDGDLVKIMSWYDNEYGYVNQMAKEVKRIGHMHNRFEHYQQSQPEIELVG
jgi:glyceraldehyde 3-phosphate dehydrogenase